MDEENENSAPSSILITPAMQPANVEPVEGKGVSETSEKEEPENTESENKTPKFLVGLLLPVLLLLLINSSLFSSGAWDFNRRVEMVLSSDDDGVFQFEADPKSSHGIQESVNLIFLDLPISRSMAYRPEIHIGVTWQYERSTYNEHCEVESANAVCMYHLKGDGNGEFEFTKLGEYDQLNHTAEFVLNGEANESIGLRIDYYDSGAAEHFYEVEQPRNYRALSMLLGVALLSLIVYSAVKKDVSLLGGVGTSVVAIIGFFVLAFVLFVFQAISQSGG